MTVRCCVVDDDDDEEVAEVGCGASTSRMFLRSDIASDSLWISKELARSGLKN